MNHLDATIRLFDPDYDVSAVWPKAPRHRQQWLASGECRGLVLDALRDALEPLSARAVMQVLAAAQGGSRTPRGARGRAEDGPGGAAPSRG
ncbi:hypothetical protein [Thiocapsa roseopersicina]|uniref:hypothetical protein n=1 Tax=Thiocapsa roseopersicina TaxID=1058 RepID=UPI001FDF3644|nr:hypothetical protein [Thiocapsa roseopersicina]